MTNLPLLLALPHAGLEIPPEVRAICRLGREEIAADSDEDASEIYSLDDRVAALVRCPVARCIVDVNRAEDDLGPDGALKLVTRRKGVPIYQGGLPERICERLLERYHRPYHAMLTELSGPAILGIDCHSMSERTPEKRGQPPKTSRLRPRICLSDAGSACPAETFSALRRCLEQAFGFPVAKNDPFRGGYTIRRHARELPWVQLELSREPYATPSEKRAMLLSALEAFCSSPLKG
ncbi:MAG: N-formylglutamate amidohydrolase [Myxococcales bacterium]|nr:N-formylglutamate amidohydrolase [Myxococcales bacterium]